MQRNDNKFIMCVSYNKKKSSALPEAMYGVQQGSVQGPVHVAPVAQIIGN